MRVPRREDCKRLTQCKVFKYEVAARSDTPDSGLAGRHQAIDKTKSLGTEPGRTGFQSPWQHGIVERLVATCRRTCAD
jgi:hypothetical protein